MAHAKSSRDRIAAELLLVDSAAHDVVEKCHPAISLRPAVTQIDHRADMRMPATTVIHRRGSIRDLLRPMRVVADRVHQLVNMRLDGNVGVAPKVRAGHDVPE